MPSIINSRASTAGAARVSSAHHRVLFTPIDRGLRINSGMKVGIKSVDYTPLAAAVKDRFIRSTTGRVSRDKSFISLMDYDTEKVLPDT